ncbi:helix-turn-helix domain-containing protein [Vannielia litorea]|uniref:helix-turn-helix domain-containing protein n=1 Tax=Vannielia litorea TaxID=1217970 RepID=UPI000940C70D
MKSSQDKIKRGRRILSARRARHLTQAEVSEALGVERATVSQWERGKNNPSYELMMRLAKVLRAPLDTLAFGVPDRFIGHGLRQKRISDDVVVSDVLSFTPVPPGYPVPKDALVCDSCGAAVTVCLHQSEIRVPKTEEVVEG